MKIIPRLLPLCALLLPCALSAESFEGRITMSINSANSKNGPQTMNISMKDGNMRMDMSASQGHGGFGGMIMDIKNQQMIILIPQMKAYMVQPIPQPGSIKRPNSAPPVDHGDLVESGIKETILGYVCTKFTHTSAQGVSEIWVTDQLGTFMGLSPAGGQGRQAPQGWESALKGRNFFPLRVVTTANGKEKATLEVTSVEKASLRDSLFQPPDGWRKIDIGSMMGRAMPGGFPGQRPSDGNN